MNLKAGEKEQRAHAELLEHCDAFILGREVAVSVLRSRASKRGTVEVGARVLGKLKMGLQVLLVLVLRVVDVYRRRDLAEVASEEAAEEERREAAEAADHAAEERAAQ